MQRRLNPSDIVFLIDVLEDDSLLAKLQAVKESGVYVSKGRFATGRCSLDFTEGEMGMIRDSLSDFIVSVGVNESGELNAKGLEAEGLIDVFRNVDD